MRALLLGANGLLGQNLVQTCLPDFELLGAGLESTPIAEGLSENYRPLDITDKTALQDLIREWNPDWILNAAAMTDVDGCEREPERCRLLNGEVVRWMANTGKKILHISTDYVFDGVNGPYRETDALNPLSEYGRTKLESEASALSISGSLVLRTMLLWGQGKGQKKSFNDFVRETLEAGKTARIVTDQIGDPTLAEDLATAAWALIHQGSQGVFHVSGSEKVSRMEWAQGVAQFFNLETASLHPVLTADLNQLAKRPLNSGFDCSKLVAEIGFQPRGLLEQLRHVYSSK
jgi:dTDP-4-dehydrorhamnose reductase